MDGTSERKVAFVSESEDPCQSFFIGSYYFYIFELPVTIVPLGHY
jgi:hypothetical protein